MYTFYAEVNFLTDATTSETEHCFFVAHNYTEAMGKIEDYYGDDIIDVKLFCMEEGEIFIVPEDMAKRYLEADR